MQVAGGIRSEETAAAYLEAGAQFVVVGTRALKTPHLVEDLCLEFPGHVLVGLEVPARERGSFRRFLKELGYEYAEETRNPAYRLFLR